MSNPFEDDTMVAKAARLLTAHDIRSTGYPRTPEQSANLDKYVKAEEICVDNLHELNRILDKMFADWIGVPDMDGEGVSPDILFG